MKELWGNVNFRRLWLSQIALALGDAFMQMGFLELFSAHGYDPRVETAKMFFAVSLPGLVLGPVAMMYLDRWQRRTVLMVSDVVRAGIVAGIIVWLLPLLAGHVDQRNLLLAYLGIGLIGVVAAFYLPARSALLPNLVAPENLVKANTLFATSVAIATVGGRALGGLVAETAGVTWAVAANGFAYVASVSLLWRIQMNPHATTGAATSMKTGGWTEFKTGLAYLWKHPTAMPLVLLSAVFAFLLGLLAVVFIGYARDTLGLRTGGIGYLVAAAGIGAGVGICLLSKSAKQSDWLPFAQLLLAAGALIALSYITSVWLAALVVVVLGGVAATVVIYIDARLQAQVEDVRRGAVFAARGMLTSLTMVVAFWLQFGTTLLKRTPAPLVLFWLGVGAAGIAVLMLTLSRAKRA